MNIVRVSKFLIAAVVAALVTLVAGTVGAAPQALGLVATASPTPLICRDGECAAMFASFCLQRHRIAPFRGTLYRPARNIDITLVVTRADGTEVRLPGNDRLLFRAGADYTLVRISIDEPNIAALGGVQVAVEVGRHASLVPMAIAGDTDPMSPRELAAAIGPDRTAAAAFFESGTTELTRLTTWLINALPEKGRLALGRRDDVWRRAEEAGRAQGIGEDAIERAGQSYRGCASVVGKGSAFGMRGCMIRLHHHRQSTINKTFWRSLAGV